MAVNVVAVDNAPELLEKIEGIFRNMAEISLLGSFEDVQYSGFFSGGMENSGIRIHRKTVHEAGYHENGRAIPKRVGKWR